MTTLETLRDEINALDQQLLALLNQRAELALKIGQCKQALGVDEYHVPTREVEVLSRLCSVSQGPLPDTGIEAIYRQIMAACLQLQRDSRKGEIS